MTKAGLNRVRIPLDESGAMVNMLQWPWYWRYPLAVAGMAVCIWLAVTMTGVASADTNWKVFLVFGVAAFACSTLTYELWLLGFFAGLIYGFTKLVTLIFPSANSVGWLPTLGVIASVIACWALIGLSGRIDEVKESNAMLLYKVDELARQIDRSAAYFNDKLSRTESDSSDHWCE